MTESQGKEVQERPSPSRGRRLAVAAVVGVFVLGAAGGGAYAFHRHQITQAVDACQAQVARLSAAESAADRLRGSERFKTASAIDARHVQDEASVAALRTAVEDAGTISQRMPSCEHLSIQDTRKLTTDLRGRTTSIRDHSTAIGVAVDAVVASRDAKTLADAKASLAKAVKTAQGTLDSSHGKVADNATRVRLQQAIDAANKVLSDKGVKAAKRYQDAQSSLAAPVKGVNDSVAAKAAADKAAADAAARAAAQAAQARSSSVSSGSSSSKSYSGSGYSGSGGSSSGSSTRSQSAGGSSSGSAGKSTSGGSSSSHSNSGSSSSGSGSGFDLTPSKPIQGCVDGKSVCPIG